MFNITILLQKYKFYITSFIVCFLCLSPVLKSGLYSDDIGVNGVIRSRTIIDGITIWSLLSDSFREWESKGRFFPIALTTTVLVNYFITNIVVYKLYIFIMTIINVCLLSCFIYVTTKSKIITTFVFLIFPICIQYRYYHDAALSFTGMLQLCMTFLIISLIFFILFIRYGSLINGFISALSYSLAMLTYEVSYPFILTILLLSLFSQRKYFRKTFATLCLFILICAGILFHTYQLRLNNNDVFNAGYQGIKIHNDFSLIKQTFFTQLKGSLPFIYVLSNPEIILTDLTKIGSLPLVFIILGLSFYIALETFDKYFINDGIQHKHIIIFTIVGISFLIFPALALSPSEKYQQELVINATIPGQAHIPVYIQYYGSTILIFILLFLILRRLKLPKVIIAGVFSSLISFNYLSNSSIIYHSNIYITSRTELLNNALRRGLLDTVPSQSTLLVSGNYHYDILPRKLQNSYFRWPFDDSWINTYSIHRISGKIFTVIQNADINNNIDSLSQNIPLYRLKFESYPSESSVNQSNIILEKIDAVVFRDNTLIFDEKPILKYSYNADVIQKL